MHSILISGAGVGISALCVKRFTSEVERLTAPAPLALSSEVPTLSSLARQLGESAVRAQAREQALTRSELQVEVRRLRAQISGEGYAANKQVHDDEKPKTQDPELLQRAHRATEYVMKVARLDPSAVNPFSGLPRDQLDLIAYDEAGPYTVNERRAAYYGVLDMELKWNQWVMRISEAEGAVGISNRPKFCKEVLAHYRTLPAIEQAEYAPDYESRLEAQINETPDQREGFDKPLTLFDVLARHWRFKKVERTTSGVGIGNSS